MLLVIILPPSFDLSSGVPQTGEPVRLQAFITHASVEALHVGILHRLDRLNGYLRYHGTFTTIDFPGATFSFAGVGNPKGDIVGNTTILQASDTLLC
jgi:hypothetical protein